MKKLNIIIPILNEEKRLESGVHNALRYLQDSQIPHILSLVDNGSLDSTPQIARALCAQYENLEYLRLEERGVGLALRAAIAHNEARSQPCAFIGYMDIDLSTDLRHLKEVYERLDSGAEIVIGSRLLAHSQVIGRSLKREVLSRALNTLLKLTLKARFSDAMCGFKFYNATTASKLKALCSEDKSWFYCAQMLLIAQYQGIQIEEIPVIWRDEATDSKVRILRLSRIYLQEICRLFFLLRLGGAGKKGGKHKEYKHKGNKHKGGAR